MSEGKIMPVKEGMLLSDPDNPNQIIFPVTVGKAIIVKYRGQDCRLDDFLEQFNPEVDLSGIESDIAAIQAALNKVSVSLSVASPIKFVSGGTPVTFTVVVKEGDTTIDGDSYQINLTIDGTVYENVPSTKTVTVQGKGDHSASADISYKGTTYNRSKNFKTMNLLKVGMSATEIYTQLDRSELTESNKFLIDNDVYMYQVTPDENEPDKYLWVICDSETSVGVIKSSGFNVTYKSLGIYDGYRYYRSVDTYKAGTGTKTFKICHKNDE